MELYGVTTRTTTFESSNIVGTMMCGYAGPTMASSSVWTYNTRCTWRTSWPNADMCREIHMY